MRVFRNRTTLQAAWDVGMFSNLETGLIRARRRMARKGRVLWRRTRRRLSKRESGGIRPENIIWMFGFGRSGSTWLMNMMGSLKRHNAWEEPMFGELFGSFYGKAPQFRLRHRSFIASDRHREDWLRSIRNFVLESALQRYPGMTSKRYLIIKEPFGSAGAPLLLEALPESRVIFLVRDPRDVLASYLDGARRESWIHKGHMLKGIDDSYETDFADADRHPDLFVESRAELLMENMMGAKRAYEAHRGPKVLIRYEELRADTPGTMNRIFDALGLSADKKELSRVIEQHSWENIPKDEKGEGKFFRKAIPGSWQEDLTPKQIKTVERITAPILEEFYGG